MSVEAARVALVIFAMPGCPACHEYLPRLYRQIAGFQQLGVPFVYYEQGMVVKAGQIPIVIIDSTSNDPSVVALADQYKIEALPTTLILRQHGPHRTIVGSMPDKETYEMLNEVVASN